MDTYPQLQADITAALRAGEKEKLSSLRYLYSEIQYAQINKGKDAVLDEKEVQQQIRSLVKKSEEAIEQYKAGNREDLAVAEVKNVELWKTYLPQQMSDGDLSAIVEKIHTEKPDLAQGPLTGMVMREVAGRADGGRVAAAIRTVLGL